MKNSLLLYLLFSFIGLFAQENLLKEKALSEFKKEHYDEAVKLMEGASKESPDDAEIYYYLGFFNHYRAYDSRPLSGYDYSYSENIFNYLNKALELDPDFGDAKYFYGAECSGNAFQAMQNRNIEKLKHFYRMAYDIGAYPAWLMEFGRNMLNSCEKNAILFMGGNNDFDVCLYLQLFEYFRTDITIIPIGNIDRPWYVKLLKNGLENAIRPVVINLDDNQIMDIHPFKWDTTSVNITVSADDRFFYNLDQNYKMKWKLEPDLISDRTHSKIEGEKAEKRTYLSPQRAILLQIVEDNFSSRPIYFSNMSDTFFAGGLDKFFQNCGLVSRLLPFKTSSTKYSMNYSKMEDLIQDNNFVNYNSIKKKNLPRISQMVFNYHYCIIYLAEHYKDINDFDALRNLKEFYTNKL